MGAKVSEVIAHTRNMRAGLASAFILALVLMLGLVGFVCPV